MFRIFVLFFIVTLIFSCENKNETGSDSNGEINLSKDYSLDWLEGKRIDTTTMAFRKTSYGEDWIKMGENNFIGYKYSIVKGDSNKPLEQTLIKTEGLFYLSYTIKGEQHTFVQDSINENYIRFNHLQDNFPTTLIYSLNNNTLFITSQGMANGFSRSNTFKYLKSN